VKIGGKGSHKWVGHYYLAFYSLISNADDINPLKRGERGRAAG